MPRVRCKVCHGTCTLLPEFVTPYKHYASQVISAQFHRFFGQRAKLKSVSLDASVPEATIRDWLNQFELNFSVLIHRFFTESVSERPVDSRALWLFLERRSRASPDSTLGIAQCELCQGIHPIGIFREILVTHNSL